jgi:mRNA interferase RelE/StbE
MVLYKVIIDKRVRKKDLLNIPAKDRARIVKCIAQLESDPYTSDSIQLKGRTERRIRQGDYRILYIVEDKIVTVFVVRVGHRREIYKP